MEKKGDKNIKVGKLTQEIEVCSQFNKVLMLMMILIT